MPLGQPLGSRAEKMRKQDRRQMDTGFHIQTGENVDRMVSGPLRRASRVEEKGDGQTCVSRTVL